MALQRLCSEESESRCQRLETSVNFLVEEKEDLAMVPIEVALGNMYYETPFNCFNYVIYECLLSFAATN